MSFVSELTEAEIAREEALNAQYALLVEDTCPNCGCRRGGGITCIRCGSLKEPTRRPIPPFRWVDVLGAANMPPGFDGVGQRDTKPDNVVDTKAVKEAPKAPEPRTKQEDKRPDIEPAKARAPHGKSAQGGLFG